MSLMRIWTFYILYMYLFIDNSDAVDDTIIFKKRMIRSGSLTSLSTKGLTTASLRTTRAAAAVRRVSPPGGKCGDGGGDGRNCSLRTGSNPGITSNATQADLCLAYSPIELKKYDPKTHICCNGLYNRTSPGETCCSGVVINTETDVCCGDTHLRKSPNVGCCLDTFFNTNETLCCNGTMLSKTKYSVCCGDRVILTITEICCGGRTFPKPLGDVVECCGDSVCSNPTTTYFSTLHTDGHESATHPVSDVTKVYHDVIIVPVTVVGTALLIVGVLLSIICWKRKLLLKINKGSKNYCSILSLCLSTHDPAEEKLISHETNQTTATIFNPSETHPDTKSIASYGASIVFNDKDIVPYNIQDFVDVLETIDKPRQLCPGNEIGDQFKDMACQTTSPEKTCNRRTVLGQPFEHRAVLDLKQPVFQMPHSDVSVRLPDSNLSECPIEMYGASFHSIPSIYQQISIPPTEEIASPTVEYLLTGVTELNDFAVVKLPFIGNQDAITVWKFHSDDGMNTKAVPFEVPRKSKDNKELSLFYEIKGSTVYIHTRSFSGFFITAKKHNRPDCLNLTSYLFGSHKRFQNGHQVRLRLYIADGLMGFEDYKKSMFETEERLGQSMLLDTQLELTETVREEDKLEVNLTVTTAEGERWTHKLHPRTNEPIYPEIKKIKLGELLAKCPECPNCHFIYQRVPYATEWILVSSNDSIIRSDTFSCVIDVNCVTERQEQPTVLTVDELPLRAQDRLPIEESNERDRLQNLQNFLGSMEEREKEKFVEKIKEKFQCQGARIPDIFPDMLRKMKPVGVYEVTVATLRSADLHNQLHRLEKQNVLADIYFPKPVQSTGSDGSERDRNMDLAFSRMQGHGVAERNNDAVHSDSELHANDTSQNGPNVNAMGQNESIAGNVAQSEMSAYAVMQNEMITNGAVQNQSNANAMWPISGLSNDTYATHKELNAITAAQGNLNTNTTTQSEREQLNTQGAVNGTRRQSPDDVVLQIETELNTNVRYAAVTLNGNHEGRENSPESFTDAESLEETNKLPVADGYRYHLNNNGLGLHDYKNNAMCRNELGSDLPVCSYEDRQRLTNFLAKESDHQLPSVGQELDIKDSVELSEMTHVKQPVPVQEHASLDETDLKHTAGDED